MNLLEIRTQFVKLSGRYDLVVDNTNYADNGADWYINMGQRWLDRETEHHRELARVFRTLEAGQFFVKFQQFRVLKEVWIGTVSAKTPLEIKTYKWLQTKYAKPFNTVEQGTPSYCAPALLRINSSSDPDMDGIGGYADVMEASGEYNGLIILPPPEETFTVDILGKFYSDALSADTDESYWSINEPNILVMAALLELETFYRNTQGANDWELAIRKKLLGLEKDYVEDTTGRYNQMEG